MRNFYTNNFQGWNDAHLKWNMSAYNNINEIRIDSRLFWKPDIMLENR